jgi:hypothetical protein
MQMEMPRLSKSAIRVMRLEKDATGVLKPVVIFQRPQAAKKKGSPFLRALDRSVVRLVQAEKTMLDSYESKHEESNIKRKNGWVFDLAPNLLEASEKATRKLKLNRLSLF